MPQQSPLPAEFLLKSQELALPSLSIGDGHLMANERVRLSFWVLGDVCVCCFGVCKSKVEISFESLVEILCACEDTCGKYSVVVPGNAIHATHAAPRICHVIALDKTFSR